MPEMDMDIEVTIPSGRVDVHDEPEDLEGDWFTPKGAIISEALFDTDDED